MKFSRTRSCFFILFLLFNLASIKGEVNSKVLTPKEAKVSPIKPNTNVGELESGTSLKEVKENNTSLLVKKEENKPSKKNAMSNEEKEVIKDLVADFIGYIDPFLILEKSDEYKDELKGIEKELESRKQQLKSLEESALKKKNEIETMGNVLSETAKDRKREEFGQLEAQYRIKLQSAQEYAEKADQKARMQVLKKIQEEAALIAREEDRLLVIAGGVIYGDKRVDLTHKVITKLNNNYQKEKKEKGIKKENK